MNVWGKRTFSVAFPDNPTFDTATVTDHISTDDIQSNGGELKLDGAGNGVLLQGAHVNVNLTDPAGMNINCIPPYTAPLNVDVSDAILNAANIHVNASQNLHLTGGDSGGINIDTFPTATGNMYINTGPIVVTTNTPMKVDSGTNPGAVGCLNWISSSKVTYTPAGAGPQIAIPPGSVFAFRFPANTLTPGRSWETTIVGNYDGLAASGNTIQFAVNGGPVSGDNWFAQALNPLASQVFGFTIYFRVKFSFNIVDNSPGTVRISMDAQLTANGSASGPERATLITTDSAFDPTVLNQLQFFYTLTNPGANITTDMTTNIVY